MQSVQVRLYGAIQICLLFIIRSYAVWSIRSAPRKLRPYGAVQICLLLLLLLLLDTHDVNVDADELAEVGGDVADDDQDHPVVGELTQDERQHGQ